MTEREALKEIICKIGVLTYGKERWFKQNGCWYDRMNGDYIQNETLVERICDELEAEIEAEQTEPQQVVRLKHFKCPKCGRSDYIRSFEDWGVDGGIYKYKCINCNTYIKDEP